MRVLVVEFVEYIGDCGDCVFFHRIDCAGGCGRGGGGSGVGGC